MSDEHRLILRPRPRHHRHRFLVAVALCILAVIAIWALQMKTTFSRYHTEREQGTGTDALSQAKARLQASENAADLTGRVNELRSQIEDLARTQAAKDAILDQVKTEMAPDAAAQVPPPAPAVAGATTEVTN